MANMISMQSGSNAEAPEGTSVLEVEAFGKIARAEISNAPLSVFVGKNNTGKSYIAYAMWAAWSGFFGLSPFRGKKISAPKWFKDEVNKACKGKPTSFKIEASRVARHYNTWLSRNKRELAQDLLSFDGADFGKLRFEFSGNIYLHCQKRPPNWVTQGQFKEWSVSPWAFSWTEKLGSDSEQSSMVGSLQGDDLANVLYRVVLEKLINRDIRAVWRSATYLPAARTGLVLAIQDLAASSVGNIGISDKNSRRSRFTAPMREFLMALIRLTEHRRGNQYKNVGSFLRKSIFQGNLEIEGKGSPEFTYVTGDGHAKLPMHIVSSMISEMTPIVALLENSYLGDGLIIEEPEAHLHLAAQREMARAIIRLVNSGLRVAVTTHSDTFLQQVNLASRAAKRKNDLDIKNILDFDEDDLLNPDQVKVYEFIEKDGRTFVEPATFNESGGFAVKSINETLFDIAEDVIALGAHDDT